jgi:hypothetical protein
VSQAQLNFIKAMVQAHVDPMYSAFVKATNSSSGSLNYTQTISANLAITGGLIVCGSTSNPNYGCSNSDDDGTAAYVQALLWYITGNQTYANNAINLMNYYAQNVTGYGNVNGQNLPGIGTVSSLNTPLQAAWDSQKWPRAAEIIRYSNAGWPPAQAAAFGQWMNNIMVPQLINGTSSNGNWETSMIEGLIGIGVYNDDAAVFNQGVTYWKQRMPAYFYYYTDGSSPVPAPRGTANWYGQTVFDPSMNGISQESCRDFGHAQYGISGIMDAAETAHIQGETPDLYEDVEVLTGSAAAGDAGQGTFAVNAQDRLTSALEFNAYYLLNNPVPATLCDDASADQSVANNTIDLVEYPTDEIGYNEYHNRRGLDLPYTIQYLNQTIRQISDPTEYHIMVYETLTHGGDAAQLPPFMMWTNATSTTVQTGSTSAPYTVTVVPGSNANPSVTLSVSGLPVGASYDFTPATVTGAGTSTLQITAGTSTVPGAYPLTITGTGGGKTYTNSLSLVISEVNANFSLASVPSVVSVTAGDAASFPVTLTPLNNYLGNVNLSVTSGLPPGAVATFTPATVTNASQSSMLKVLTQGITPPGAYNLTISGTDGVLTNTTQSQLIVGPISNACIAQMGYYWVTGSIPEQTGTFTAEWDATPSLTGTENANVGLTYTNMQSVDGTGTYTDLSVAGRFNPSGDIDARNGAAFSALATIPYTAGQTYHFRAVVNVPAATYSMYVTPPGQSEIAIGTNYAFRTGAATGTPPSINYWNATAQVGSLALCNMVIETPSFALSPSPDLQTVKANSSTSYTVAMTPIDGYSGNVALSATGLPAGATASFKPATLTGNVTSSTMTVSTSAATTTGTNPIAITGSDGTLTNTAYVELAVTPPCQVPSATAQSVSVPEYGTQAITLAGIPGAYCASTDSLTSAVTANPSHGALTGTAPNLVYTPTTGYVGSDSFSFTVSDSNAATPTSSPATVNIVVATSTCQAPSATSQTVSLTENGALAVTLAGTPGSGCGATDTLTSTVTVNPMHGVLTGTAPNLEYTPTQGYVGSDSFSFTMTDSTALTAPGNAATINITVAAPVTGIAVLSSVTPQVILAGSPAISLTVNGSGFIPNSIVQWNGSSRTTSYVSATQLTAALTPTDLSTPGLMSVTVSNPGTSGGVSAHTTLAVDSNTEISLIAKITSYTVAPGNSVSTPLTFQNLASGSWTTVQCYNLPSGANCSYNQQTETITITTGLSTPAGTYQVLVVGNFNAMSQQAQSTHSSGTRMLCGLLGLPLGLIWVGRKRRCWLYTSVGILGLLLIFVTGCSSSTAKGPGVTTTQAATTLTITVS